MKRFRLWCFWSADVVGGVEVVTEKWLWLRCVGVRRTVNNNVIVILVACDYNVCFVFMLRVVEGVWNQSMIAIFHGL